MIIFNTNFLPELRELPSSDREMIVQKLHWAMAEDMGKMEIPLNYFREGEPLLIYKADYRDLYDMFVR